MIIKLSPQRRDDQLTATVKGDVITVNGLALDFGPLPEGATLPQDAIDSEWITGSVTRIDGQISLTLLLPHGASPSDAVAFPEAIEIDEGDVPLPFDPVTVEHIDLGAIDEEAQSDD